MSEIPSGIRNDRARQRDSRKVAAASDHLEICVRCEGSGNEFYAMYKECSVCGGDGVVGIGGDDAAG